MTQVKRAVSTIFVIALIVLGLLASQFPQKTVHADDPTPTPTSAHGSNGNCQGDTGTC